MDRACGTALPVLVSGVESILFAINIDSDALNIPSKIKSNSLNGTTAEPVESVPNVGSLPTNYHMIHEVPTVIAETKIVKLRKPLHARRKNNVVVLDINDEVKENNDEKLTSEAFKDGCEISENESTGMDKSPKIVVHTEESVESFESQDTETDIYK